MDRHCVQPVHAERVESYFGLPSSKVAVIPNGINAEKMVRPADQRAAAPCRSNGERLLLFVGASSTREGRHVLIRLCRASRPNTRGGGCWSPALESPLANWCGTRFPRLHQRRGTRLPSIASSMPPSSQPLRALRHRGAGSHGRRQQTSSPAVWRAGRGRAAQGERADLLCQRPHEHRGAVDKTLSDPGCA